MKPEILILTPLYDPTVEALKEWFTVHKLWEQPDPQGYLKQAHPEIRAVATSGVMGFRREHIANLPNVEIVAAFGVAHGTLDLEVARERGIAVTNTPDSSADTVADLAVALMLDVMRRVSESDRFIRAGTWEKKTFPMAAALKGKMCGIVGLGNIGRGIAKRAEPFGMKVGYFGPRRKSDVPYPYYSDVVALAKDADCLILACPERPDTRNLVKREALQALGPRGFLVNIARGSVLEQDALLEALQTKAIAGAAMDVFWDEPHVPASLLGMDNVLLTPHIGTSTLEIRQERGALLIGNLRAHFAGEPLLTPVK